MRQSLGQAYGAYPSTSLNDYHVDEVKHGIRYIVGYKPASYRRQKLGQPNEELDFGGDRNM